MACIEIEGHIVGMGGFEIGTSHKGINAMEIKKMMLRTEREDSGGVHLLNKRLGY